MCDPDDNAPMRITVVTNDGRTHALQVAPSLTAGNLKAAITDRPLLLTFAGMVLDDACTMSACRIQDGAVLREMQPRGWFAARTNYQNRSPFHYAAEEGRSDAVSVLLRCNPDGVKGEDKDGKSPSHYAAARGHCDVLTSLLRLQPKQAQRKDLCGKTVHHYATEGGHYDALKFLLLRFPDVTMEHDNDDRTPFYYAVTAPTTSMLELLLQHCARQLQRRGCDNYGWSLFHHAAWGGHCDALALLVRRFPDGVKDIDRQGWSPFHCAAAKGHCDVLELLLSVHSDGVNSVDRRGRTPFDCALGSGHHDAMSLLRRHLVLH